MLVPSHLRLDSMAECETQAVPDRDNWRMTWSRDRVADEAEIRDVVHRYADAASRRDAAGVASVFSADGEWLAEGMGHHQGPDALTFFGSMPDGWNAFTQALLSGVITFDAVDADRASGRCFALPDRCSGAQLVRVQPSLRTSRALSRRNFGHVSSASGSSFSSRKMRSRESPLG